MIKISVEEPQKLKISGAPDSEPGYGEISVGVRRAGICGTDMHILEGSNPFAIYPRIIGHEIAGIVEAVGDGNGEINVGDRVVVDPVISCGECYPCRIGRSNVCAHLEVLGVHRDGGFCSSFIVPANNAVPVSSDIPLGIAALAEPFSVAANILSLTGCTEDDNVLVYGAGTIGLAVLQVAKLSGARCLVADLDRERLEFANEFGADATICATNGAVKQAVAGETEGLGPTVVIDAAGNPELLREAVSVVCPAGRVGLLGFSVDPSTVIGKDIVGKEVAVFGSRLSRKLLPKVVKWLEIGELAPAGMISGTFPAVEAEAAFAKIKQSGSSIIKIQLEF